MNSQNREDKKPKQSSAIREMDRIRLEAKKDREKYFDEKNPDHLRRFTNIRGWKI